MQCRLKPEGRNEADSGRDSGVESRDALAATYVSAGSAQTRGAAVFAGAGAALRVVAADERGETSSYRRHACCLID